MKRTFTENQLAIIKELKEKAAFDVLQLVFHYSRGNTKLKFFNFGMPAVITCPDACKCNADCTHFCYGLNAENRYSNVFRANYENMLLFNADPALFEKRLRAALDAYIEYCKKAGRDPVARLCESGDIFNKEYALMLFRVAADYAGVKFYGYTKNYFTLDFVNDIPFYSLSNCNIMLSKIDGVKIPEKYDGLYNIAYTTKLNGAPALLNNGVKHCIGDCNKCGLCINKGNDVFFVIHGSGNFDYIPEKIATPEKRAGLVIPVLSKYENTENTNFYKTSSKTFQGIRNIYCKKIINDNSYESRTRALLTVYNLYRAGKIEIYKNGFVYNP